MIQCKQEVFIMYIWDGDKLDSTNHKTEKYLQINSCGLQNLSAGWTVVREKGRYDYHLLLVNSGELEVECADKCTILKRGNFVIYKPGQKQCYKAISETSYLWMHFGGTSADEILSSYSLDNGLYLTEYNMTVFSAYSYLIQQYNQPNLRNYTNGTLLILLAHIANMVKDAHTKKIPEAISEIITYINMNYNKQHTIEELSQKVGYSKSRFSHLFKEITSMTPLTYLNDIRLRNACEMLMGTTYPIGEIALCCGFEDQLYFCRVFKKKYNISPSEYRRKSMI